MDPEQIYEILGKAYFSECCDERKAIDALSLLFEGRRNFLDIGASLGQYTHAANACLREGRIIAVEADPVRFARLQCNCKNWEQIGTNQITAIHAAVAEHSEGPIEFQTTNSNVSGGLARHSLDHLPPEVAQHVRWETIRVPGTTIDDICKNYFPDIVKMDIEGAELSALKGATRTLARKTTLWLIELHDFKTADGLMIPDAVRDLMWRNGYVEEMFYGKSLFRRSNLRDYGRLTIVNTKRVIRRLLLKGGLNNTFSIQRAFPS